jgi:hypothetical protein
VISCRTVVVDVSVVVGGAIVVDSAAAVVEGELDDGGTADGLVL